MLKRLILVAIFALCFMLISAQIIGFAEIRDLKDSAVAAWSFEGNLKENLEVCQSMMEGYAA